MIKRLKEKVERGEIRGDKRRGDEGNNRGISRILLGLNQQPRGSRCIAANFFLDVMCDKHSPSTRQDTI